MNDNMTLTELVNEYSVQKDEESREFLESIERSLDFTQHSIMCIPYENDLALKTMIPLEKYVAAMTVLTNNFDDKFKDFIQNMRYENRGMDNKIKEDIEEINLVASCVCESPEFQTEKARQQMKSTLQQFTVGDVLKIQKELEEEQARIEHMLEEKRYQEEKYQEEKYQEEKYQEEQRRQLEGDRPDYEKMFETAALTIIAGNVVHDLSKAKEMAEEAGMGKVAGIEVVEGSDDIEAISAVNEYGAILDAAKTIVDDKKGEVKKDYELGNIGNKEDSVKNLEIKKEVSDKKQDIKQAKKDKGISL